MKKSASVISIFFFAIIFFLSSCNNDPTTTAKKIVTKGIEKKYSGMFSLASFEKTDAISSHTLLGIEVYKITFKCELKCIRESSEYNLKLGELINFNGTMILEKHEQGWVEVEE